MNKLSQAEFGRMRAIVQPVTGGKEIYAWTQSVALSHLSLEVAANGSIEIGKNYLISLNGRKTSALFEAQASTVEDFDVRAHGTESMVSGTNVKMIEAETTVIKFTIVSPVRYASATERFHIRLEGVSAVIKVAGESMVAQIVDASENGIAVSQYAPLEVGGKVELSIKTGIGEVLSNGIVRNCTGKADGSFRIGIEMIAMGRIDGPRWHRFLDEI